MGWGREKKYRLSVESKGMKEEKSEGKRSWIFQH